MISEHSAHLAPLSVDFRTWLWRYTYLLLLISMLWHRQAIFKSKGDKLCSSAEGRIWTRGPRHQIASRLNARWQTDWAIEDQAKKLELDSPSAYTHTHTTHTHTYTNGSKFGQRNNVSTMYEVHSAVIIPGSGRKPQKFSGIIRPAQGQNVKIWSTWPKREKSYFVIQGGSFL